VPGAIARQHLYFISEEIGPRPAGSEAETQTAQYLQSILEDLGYPVQLQPFTKVGWVGEDERETRIRSANVIATKAGASEQMIVIGAHYDSVSVGHGADDNASGVAVLLELAETLRDTPTPYTLRFVAFGAEEVGPLGSDAYVEQLSATERRNTIAMINLDSVTAGDHLYVYSIEGQGAVVRDWALAWATQNGIVLQTIPHIDLSDEDGYPTADYAAFQNVGIPFAYFEATNWALGDQDGYTQVDPQYGDYGTIFHTEFDRLAYLDETFPGRVDEHLELVIRIVQAILTQFKLD
jgi:Zn-dependent M28 family amino/carboxypeptidase